MTLKTSFPEVTEEDDAILLYTSGTTGIPKGVILSHKNMVAGRQYTTVAHVLTPEDRALCSLPLYHINCLDHLGKFKTRKVIKFLDDLPKAPRERASVCNSETSLKNRRSLSRCPSQFDTTPAIEVSFKRGWTGLSRQ